MLDDLAELRTFQQILLRGSLTGAADSLGLSVAVVSKRLANLERRTGVRLVNRTTRSLSATEEGARLLIEVERALEAISQGEEMLTTGRNEPVGRLRVSAPIAYGRRHVAPVLGGLVQRHHRLTVSLSLEDQLVDVLGGTVDVAIRIGTSTNNNGATTRKIADNRRILLASPAYLDRCGRPTHPQELEGHELLRFAELSRPWRLFNDEGEELVVSYKSRLQANSGEAAHEWCVAGFGITHRSEMDVRSELESGELEQVLPHWHAGEAPVMALFPPAAAIPHKTRVFLDAMVEESLRRARQTSTTWALCDQTAIGSGADSAGIARAG